MERDYDPTSGFSMNTGGGATGPGDSGGLVRLALEALLDPDFYAQLREDPRRAAESRGIQLTDTDIAYLESEVHWGVVDAHMAEMRDALHLAARRAGPLW